MEGKEGNEARKTPKQIERKNSAIPRKTSLNPPTKQRYSLKNLT